MIHRGLLEELKPVAARMRCLYAWTALALGWWAAALVGLGVWAAARAAGWAPSWAGPAVAAVAVVGTLAALGLAWRRARDPRRVARRVEARHPDLSTLLLAAVEQRPALPGGRFGYLQERLIRGALDHARKHDWLATVSRRRLRGAQIACVAALALVCTGIVDLVLSPHYASRGEGLFAAWRRGYDYRVTVAPGDVEIERGTSLVVTARFAARVPDDATMIYRQPEGETTYLPMSLSLSDPMFGARVDAVARDLTYRVQYAGRATRDFHVTVFDYPELVRADVSLVFPEYTGMPQKRVEDTRRVTAVEGTRVTLDCRLNKPVQAARLVGESDPIELEPRGTDAATCAASWTLRKRARYKLRLVDDRGRENKQPPEFVFQVLPNRPADIKVVLPARDVRVSPLEELQTKASVWDDFGLRRYGISYSMAAGPSTEIALGGPDVGKERKEIAHLVDFEAVGAQPDQLLSYYFWAEDTGPDGQPRRTSGDMYFAEVRHFEEIFRQGEQPPGGQSPQDQEQQGGAGARQAEELAEKQKEIINATWTVIRREQGPEPTARFGKDTHEIATAQQEALGQAEELARKLEDPESQGHATAVVERMRAALAHLGQASESNSPGTLQPALAAERGAYQALLKLRAREHRVMRGNPSQRPGSSTSATGARSRFQQQLNQLALSDEENRYETERQARPPEDEAQRENREVLSRLRELARRQGDLNERLKELQSALEEATTEVEREEIKKRLQRLRDQERQMLRDTDALVQRMQRPENQERMAESRDQLQRTRENVRQAADSVQQGQVSQAVASGTRAERELDQMREQFRRRAAGRFSEEAAQLRDDARRLDNRQREVGEQLRRLDQGESGLKSLRDSGKRDQMVGGFDEQKRDLGQLLDRMQEVVEEAEEAEPLLTQQLYDALREARQQKLDDALDTARMLLDRGFLEQSETVESRAAQGIGQLREGVEQAAESVLGDETEALRRARDVLEDLADQVDEEIRRAQAGGSRPSDDRDVRQRPGQRPGEDRQAGERERQGDGQQAELQQNERPPNSPSLRRPGQGEDRTARNVPRGLERFLDPQRPPGQRPSGPIAGDGFLQWSDRLRDVEDMVEDPDLRAGAARIRDHARGIRNDLRRRDFEGPNWELVREMVAQPLAELRDRVAEEIARRSPGETLVPIDRDPVPPKYADQVRRYYETLGSGR